MIKKIFCKIFKSSKKPTDIKRRLINKTGWVDIPDEDIINSKQCQEAYKAVQEFAEAMKPKIENKIDINLLQKKVESLLIKEPKNFIAQGTLFLLNERKALEHSPVELNKELKKNLVEFSRHLTDCKRTFKKIKFRQRTKK